MIDWRPFQDVLDHGERFALSSHVRPDADAIGSELGMALILEALGKQVIIVNPSATPAHLAFLDPEHHARKLGETVTAEEAASVDVHLILDTCSWQQLSDVGSVLKSTSARKVVIDHHASSDDLGAEMFKDVSSSATGMLVVELAEFFGVPITPEIGVPLFSAIATDTGWFKFPNTDARTMSTASRLIDAGVEPNLLYRELYERSSPARLKLRSRVLSRVQFEFGGRVGHTFVELKDFAETGAHPSDTEDMVNDCLSVDGVECAFIIVEQRSGQLKLSLRSRKNVNVAEIAESFGGGGHRQAAGATLPRPIATARQTVLQAFEQALETAAP